MLNLNPAAAIKNEKDDVDEAEDRFPILYQKHCQDMYAIAYSILHNNEDAEDAVHDAFVSISNNFEEISELSPQEIKNYFIIITRNASIDIYRKNKRKLKYNTSLEENKEETFKSVKSVEDDFFEKYNYELLKKAISELPDNYKDVIFLYYYKEVSTKEISQLLDISQLNVWKRLERAKKMLKKKLKEVF